MRSVPVQTGRCAAP